jgi:uncharacterized protein (DUF2062 family)
MNKLTPSNVFFAKRDLLMTCKNTKEQTNIQIVIGFPYWIQNNTEAACPVAINGLNSRLSDIRGVDFIQALELAILLTSNLLKSINATHLITWLDGEPYFDE